jgi:hypothetical protein
LPKKFAVDLNSTAAETAILKNAHLIMVQPIWMKVKPAGARDYFFSKICMFLQIPNFKLKLLIFKKLEFTIFNEEWHRVLSPIFWTKKSTFSLKLV